MNRNDKVENILFSGLLDNYNAVLMDNSVVLNDNNQESESLTRSSYLSDGYPKRITFATIIICVDGEMRLRLNLVDYQLRKNDVMIISPGTIGESMAASPDCRICMIAFSDVAYNLSAKDKMSLMLRNYIYRNPVLISLSEKYTKIMVEHYNLMRVVLSDSDFKFAEDAIKAHLSIICAIMVQFIELEKDTISETPRGEVLFNQFLNDVRANFSKSRSVGYYAVLLCISPRYLSHLVKNVSGRQPSEWIRDYVILNAKAMLRSGAYNIQQVSDLLSFPNPSFFGKYFKEHVGCTPRAYQNQKD